MPLQEGDLLVPLINGDRHSRKQLTTCQLVEAIDSCLGPPVSAPCLGK